MLNQPVNVFLAGANKKLGSVAECLLLSEIYVRGCESSAFVMSRDYVEKSLGIKKTSQSNYYNKFVKLGLCAVEIRGNKRIIRPNMPNILKFIEEGSQELLNDLEQSNIPYEIKNKEPKKNKKPKQQTILKTTYKSKIDYKYMQDSLTVKEYKNLRAKGDKFKGEDGVFYHLSKLDNAINSDNYNDLTTTDYIAYFKIIYEEFYGSPYLSNNRDILNMKRFINSNKVDKKNIINWFINFMENYEKLGYSNKNYPNFTIWTLTLDWIVNGIIENNPKYSNTPKNDSILRWDDSIDTSQADLYTESDEEF